jgi:hypothetical protein
LAAHLIRDFIMHRSCTSPPSYSEQAILIRRA